MHTNGSETDIRDFVKKRKISGGTRSEVGRQCRDTFISLKKTCRKLDVSFWKYLIARHGIREQKTPLLQNIIADRTVRLLPLVIEKLPIFIETLSGEFLLKTGFGVCAFLAPADINILFKEYLHQPPITEGL